MVVVTVVVVTLRWFCLWIIVPATIPPIIAKIYIVLPYRQRQKHVSTQNKITHILVYTHSPCTRSPQIRVRHCKPRIFSRGRTRFVRPRTLDALPHWQSDCNCNRLLRRTQCAVFFSHVRHAPVAPCSHVAAAPLTKKIPMHHILFWHHILFFNVFADL